MGCTHSISVQLHVAQGGNPHIVNLKTPKNLKVIWEMGIAILCLMFGLPVVFSVNCVIYTEKHNFE